MKKLILILLVVCGLAGCSGDVTYEIDCRHEALICCLSAEEYVSTRMVRGTIDGIPHVQAQGVYINNEMGMRRYYLYLDGREVKRVPYTNRLYDINCFVVTQYVEPSTYFVNEFRAMTNKRNS